MFKRILLMTIFMTSFLMAQDVTTDKAKENLAERIRKYQRNHPRSKFMYMKYGTSNVNINDSKFNTENLGIGYRNYDNDLFYGLELDTKKDNEKFKSNGTLVHFGWSPKLKGYSIKPHLAGHFGILTIEDKINNQKAKGFASILDLGFRINRTKPFSVISGIRFGKNIYDNSDFTSSKHQEFYVLFGFEF